MAAALKPIIQLRGSTLDGRMRMRKMPMLQRRQRQWRQCVTAAAAVDSASALHDRHEHSSKNQLAVLGTRSGRRGGDDGDVNYVTQEKLDQWIRDSVEEIVSNIGEAPFLVHIFSNGPLLRLEREEALPEKWQCIKKRWDQGTCPPPDGVILVEELKVDGDEDDEVTNHDEASTKTWGLVVQGKGMDCASCYVLNTCRVRSVVGFCTHFCLLRAKCFGDPLEMQIRNVWLQCSGP